MSIDELLELISKDCPYNKSWGEAVKIYIIELGEYSKDKKIVLKELAHHFAYEKVTEYFKKNE